MGGGEEKERERVNNDLCWRLRGVQVGTCNCSGCVQVEM